MNSSTAWIQRERWEALTPEQRRKFPPIAADFVIELKTATDERRNVAFQNAGIYGCRRAIGMAD